MLSEGGGGGRRGGGAGGGSKKKGLKRERRKDRDRRSTRMGQVEGVEGEGYRERRRE